VALSLRREIPGKIQILPSTKTNETQNDSWQKEMNRNCFLNAMELGTAAKKNNTHEVFTPMNKSNGLILLIVILHNNV